MKTDTTEEMQETATHVSVPVRMYVPESNPLQ